MPYVEVRGGNVEVTGEVLIAGVVVPTDHPPKGQKAVTTAGTRVQLIAASTPLPKGGCYIIPWPTNTGVIYVGGSDVSSTVGVRIGTGMLLPYPIDDANEIWIDASVSGEGVSFIGF